MLYQLSYAHQVSTFYFSVCFEGSLGLSRTLAFGRARQESNLRPAA